MNTTSVNKCYCDNADADCPTRQLYKFNGKELDMEHGLNTYDYGARQYYPALPMWDRPDPMCESYYHASPYAYCNGNPVKSVDPDGNRVLHYLVVNNDIRSFKGNVLSYNYRIAMQMFASTRYGKKVLADFTPKGKTVFGIAGNGKYANIDLVIQENRFTDEQTRYAAFGDRMAYSGLRFDKETKSPYFIVFLDATYSPGHLLSSIIHEFAIHLYKYEDVIKAFKKNNKFDDAKNQWNKISEEKEHKNMVYRPRNNLLRGTQLYINTRQELLRKYPSLEKIFHETDKNDKKTYH